MHTGEVALKTAVDEPMNLAKPVFVINESSGSIRGFYINTSVSGENTDDYAARAARSALANTLFYLTRPTTVQDPELQIQSHLLQPLSQI